MWGSDEPVSQSQIIETLANFIKVPVDTLVAPVMASLSFLNGNKRQFDRVDSVITKADLGNGKGLIEGLTLLGGLVAVAEGLTIAGNATQLGVAVVALFGLEVAAGVALLIGVGLIVLGAYLVIKGAQALWPLIRQKLFGDAEEEFRSMFR